MTKTELLEIIQNGENSGVEFKRDEIENHDLAKAVVALANLAGGMILLGVDDDGTIHGTTRENLDEWVTEICRTKIDPPLMPYVTGFDAEPGRHVVVVRILIGPDKPYARIHNNRRTYFIRVGRTSREASREELERMFQASGKLRYGMKPVPGATLVDLDRRRLKDYFDRVSSGGSPEEADIEGWERLLCNLELMVRVDDVVTPTIDGMLLFGVNPKRFLPQSGIRALAFPGTTPDYAARADQDLRGPIVALFGTDGALVEAGLVEQALDFIIRHTEPNAHIKGGRRVDRPAYPTDVLREVVVNALAHRDYSIAGTDITLTIFADRLEVKSPGRLPNSATVEAIKVGFRYARNQTLVNVLRDYQYIDFRGMGICQKIIPGMRKHNGTEPEFIHTEHDFTVRLWK